MVMAIAYTRCRNFPQALSLIVLSSVNFASWVMSVSFGWCVLVLVLVLVIVCHVVFVVFVVLGPTLARDSGITVSIRNSSDVFGCRQGSHHMAAEMFKVWSAQKSAKESRPRVQGVGSREQRAACRRCRSACAVHDPEQSATYEALPRASLACLPVGAPDGTLYRGCISVQEAESRHHNRVTSAQQTRFLSRDRAGETSDRIRSGPGGLILGFERVGFWAGSAEVPYL
jgi:hypothetical protein